MKSLFVLASAFTLLFAQTDPAQPVLASRTARILRIDGILFKDLNKNGQLDPYEDWRLPAQTRAQDLVSRMTLEEKAGLMVGPSLNPGPGGAVSDQPTYGTNPFNPGPPQLVSPATEHALHQLHLAQFIIRANLPPRQMATWLNAVQEVAERTRLGIPPLFVTNPRNHLGAGANFGIMEAASAFSQWPGTLGLAATRDAKLVEEFASIAAREYLSVGLRGAYHPTADVATEPRWNRFSETLGEDANLTAELIGALIRGFQGPALGPSSVAVVTKHFPGAGPAGSGFDAHFPHGKNQVYPGNNLDYHLLPWKAAIAAGTAMIMPYYAVPNGIAKEATGMSYNQEIVTGLLRGKLGFQGVVNSDTGISTGMPWGVESLTVKDRYRKAIEAGVDRIGGDATPELIVQLVKEQKLTEARIDESARRILRIHFALGLFENPYVNPDEAARTVRNKEFERKAGLAQRKSIVLLKNRDAILPLKPGVKMYIQGLDPTEAARHGYVSTASPEKAEVCIARAAAPSGGFMAGRSTRPIDLTLPAEQLAPLRSLAQKCPLVTVLYLERPRVIPELAQDSAALLATFGVSDEALFDVLTGKFAPSGKLPFEMPSSMDAVRAQLEDMPHDSKNPLFPIGFGLSYPTPAR
ncbi:MAG: glycoside hydrolase family 3 C-terminal domain-containing protein [Acidobacteria bacterium]|nr:glycoside hydrolase family 3 C-terminal domain-containing protein [Acidobacteriota bacterium]